MPGAAIEVDHLTKRYGSRTVVDGVSFSVAPGEVFVLVGPNGAGKTTTVETLEGYRTPDGGRVAVLGLDPQRDRRELSRRVGVMLQEGGVHPGLKPYEAVRLFAAFHPDPVPADRLLTSVGLLDAVRTPARRLSGGQQRRLALALALVGRPDVAFLDEPTAGMDPRGRASTWQVVAELRDRGTAVLLTTHSMEEAEALADRVGVVHRGRLVAAGTPRELTDTARHSTRFSTRPGLDRHALARALGLGPGAVTEPRPGEYEVAAEGTPELVASITAWLADQGAPLGDLRAARSSLEEVFLALTDDDGDES